MKEEVPTEKQTKFLTLPRLRTPMVTVVREEVRGTQTSDLDSNNEKKEMPTSRTRMSELLADVGDETARKTSRSQMTFRSRKSWSTVSGLSKPSVAQSQILTRIQDLEDALKAEKVLHCPVLAVLPELWISVAPSRSCPRCR